MTDVINEESLYEEEKLRSFFVFVEYLIILLWSSFEQFENIGMFIV